MSHCGSQERSFLYLDNTIDAILTCVTHPQAAGEVFLVSDGRNVSTPELIKMIARAMNKSAALVPVKLFLLRFLGRLLRKKEELQKLTETLIVDDRKIRRLLDWKPPFSMEEDIALTVKDHMSERRHFNHIRFLEKNIMSRIRKLGVEIGWICLGQFLIVTGGIFGLHLLTYKLSPSAYGDLSIGITLVFLAQQIFFAPMGQSFLRYYAAAIEDGQITIFIRTVRFLITRATVLISIFGVVSILSLFLVGQARWVVLISLSFMYSLTAGFTTILSYIQNAARQRNLVALHQGVGEWLHFFVPVGLILLWGPYSSTAMSGYLLASMIVLVSQLVFFRNKIVLTNRETRTKIPKAVLWMHVKKILGYAWPFSTWGLFTWAQFSSSRWALLSFSTAREVGFYSVLYQLGYYPIIIIATLVSQVATPIFFGRVGSGKDLFRVAKTIELNNFLIAITGIVTIIFVLLFFVFHKMIFSLVVAPEYQQISSLLPLLVLSGGLLAIGQIINIEFLIKADSQTMICPKTVTAIVGVFLNYIGAYFYGLIGVVVAGIVFSLIYLIWVLILRDSNNKQLKRRMLDLNQQFAIDFAYSL